MCIKCAINMSNHTIKTQLENSIEQNNFDLINTTSVQFILYACVGIFGDESKQIGLNLIKMFIEWLKNKKQPYIPSTGLEPMYNYKLLENLAKWSESTDFSVNDMDSECENKRIELFNLLNEQIRDQILT